jgi:integrase/recombinase XerD
MLRDLFPRRHRHYEDSPFAGELEAFAEWLRTIGYSKSSTNRHLCRLDQALTHCNAAQPGGTFKEADLQEAFASQQSSEPDRGTQQAFRHFLTVVGRLKTTEPPGPLEVLCQHYLRHLADARGFTAATIQQHEATVNDFLSRGLPEGHELPAVIPADVERYLQLRSKEVKRQTLQHIVGHLRSFLRFCGDRGEAAEGLDSIDTPRTYRGELPPRALDWTLVRKLLASVDRKSRNGWRDYVILHLMAYYGLRPCEVVSLTLSSIDWTGRTLRVEQSKTCSVLVLPLDDRTVRLLRRYLVEGRPGTNRPQLFLRTRSPVGALTHCGVVGIFDKRARQSGLPLQGASSYSLRHAFAIRLLRRGVGVKVIGDLLGHHSLESTCVYLRIDLDMLRAVALPVPTMTAS